MKPLYEEVSRCTQERFAPLQLKMLYRDPAKIYVAALETLYSLEYVPLRHLANLNHHGKLGIVLRPEGCISVCRLLLRNGNGLDYLAVEIPMSFCRAKTETFETNVSQIVAILCLVS